MKEENYLDMSLTRLKHLRNTWSGQALAAAEVGNAELVESLIAKIKKIEKHMASRQNENLNDLFE